MEQPLTPCQYPPRVRVQRVHQYDPVDGEVHSCRFHVQLHSADSCSSRHNPLEPSGHRNYGTVSQYGGGTMYQIEEGTCRLNPQILNKNHPVNIVFIRRHTAGQSHMNKSPWPDAPTAGRILERIRHESRSESEKGRWFENLFLRLMRDMPEFEAKEAHRWADWPDRTRLTKLPLEDTGIDLVAILNDGSLVAIQCKCYDESDTIQREKINSFLAVSGSPFDLRWVVSTCGWGRNAESIINDIEPPVRRIDFHKYEQAAVSKGQFRREAREPLPLQREAIANVVTGLSNKDRGQLIMACGTGKTYSTLQISEELVRGGGRTDTSPCTQYSTGFPSTS